MNTVHRPTNGCSWWTPEDKDNGIKGRKRAYWWEEHEWKIGIRD